MITARAVLDSSSRLVFLDVKGHAGYGTEGMDIVCSAVTALVRTAGRILLSQEDISCDFESGERGSFLLRVKRNSEGKREWMIGITEFLLRGLADLEKEYPACIRIKITIDEEMIHGS